MWGRGKSLGHSNACVMWSVLICMWLLCFHLPDPRERGLLLEAPKVVINGLAYLGETGQNLVWIEVCTLIVSHGFDGGDGHGAVVSRDDAG